MIIQDDRTEEQKRTHTVGVVARDNFMSGWGEAWNGFSRCAWACNPKEHDVNAVYNRIKDRDEMRHVNIVDLRTYRPPRGTAHFHIYVEREDRD